MISTFLFLYIGVLSINRSHISKASRRQACRGRVSPWFVFYDQALAPSWYNFTSYQMVWHSEHARKGLRDDIKGML